MEGGGEEEEGEGGGGGGRGDSELVLPHSSALSVHKTGFVFVS